MWRVAVESVLGVTTERGDTLRVAPCVPSDWPGFSVRYRVPGDSDTVYAVHVERGDAAGLTLDGDPLAVEADGSGRVPLAHDGAEHTVRLTLA